MNIHIHPPDCNSMCGVCRYETMLVLRPDLDDEARSVLFTATCICITGAMLFWWSLISSRGWASKGQPWDNMQPALIKHDGVP